MKLLPGSLGTFAGLCTEASAQVLDSEQRPIPGLYAVGNDMHSIMGGHYPSGGITLGPGMTFGYLAGKALCGPAT
ncbi:3-oxosteroid 1-dehydrogenase [compost metagenome]